jgi:hypothetical protein
MQAASREATAARDLARKLAAAAGDDPLARIRAVRDHVARIVRLAGPAFDNLPLSVLTPPDRVLAEGYGHSRDRATLFHAMLDAIGCAPELLLVASRGARNEGLNELWRATPQAGVFDAVLVRVRAAGRTIYVNDTDQYAEPGVTPYAGRPCLDAAGAFGSVPVDEAYRERFAVDYGLQVEADGTARIAVTARHFGTAQGAFRRQMERQTPEERRRYIQEAVASISQSAVLDGEYRVDSAAYPAVTEFAVRVPRFAVRDGRFLYFNLPAQMAVRLPALPNERANPYHSEESFEVVTKHEVQLPPGRILLAPATGEMVAPGRWGRLAMATERDEGGSRFRSTQTLTLAPELIESSKYAELQQAAARMRHPSLRSMLFELAP